MLGIFCVGYGYGIPHYPKGPRGFAMGKRIRLAFNPVGGVDK